MPYEAVIGAMGNILSAEINNSHAAQREHAARQQNYYYNEKSADAADQRTRQLYHDLYSPQAQMQQLQAAGLSPSIFASGGMAGKSGVSGAQGSGASGISPNVYGVDPIGAALAASQIAKTNAETENIEAKTDNEKGEGAIGKAQIAQMYANAENALKQAGYYNAATKLSEYQANHQKLQNMLLEITMPSQIKQIEYQAMNEYAMAHKALQEARKTGFEADFLNVTMDERQQQILLENMETFKYCMLLDSEIDINDAQIDKWISDTWIAWKNSDIYEQDIEQQGEWLTNRVEQFAIENGLREEEIKAFNTRTWVEGVSYTLGSAFNAVATIYTRGAAGAPTTTTTFTDPLGTTHTTTTKGKTSPKPFNRLPKVPNIRLNFRR